MKSKWTYVSGAALLAASALLFSQEKPRNQPAPNPPASSQSSYPVIGHLEKADRTITIKAGPKGSLYSVKNAEGKVLFENVSAEQLRAKAPELHELIKTGVAGKTDASMRIKADAAMR